MTVANEIKHHMALAFFGSAYADQAEECGQPLQGEIMDQLPAEIDPAAVCAARTLSMDIIRSNWKSAKHAEAMQLDTDRGLTLLFQLAQGQQDTDSKGDRELTSEMFGHYLAMQAMGTGVGLESFGDAVRDAITVPYCEFGAYSLESDYFTSTDE